VKEGEGLKHLENGRNKAKLEKWREGFPCVRGKKKGQRKRKRGVGGRIAEKGKGECPQSQRDSGIGMKAEIFKKNKRRFLERGPKGTTKKGQGNSLKGKSQGGGQEANVKQNGVRTREVGGGWFGGYKRGRNWGGGGNAGKADAQPEL